MTRVTFSVVKHTVAGAVHGHVLFPDPTLYAQITCDGANGEHLVLNYVSPNFSLVANKDPADGNTFDPVTKSGTAYVLASKFASDRALVSSGKTIYADADDAYPKSNRIYTTFDPLAVTHNTVPDVFAWLTQHPAIADAIRWADPGAAALSTFVNWPTSEQQALVQAFAIAWNHQPTNLPDPAPNQANPTTSAVDGTVVLSQADAWNLYLAHVAQGLAIEIGQRVPWSITTYTAADLQQLFSQRNLWGWDSMQGGYVLGMTSLPTPPDSTYAFLVGNGLIGSDRRTTIANLLDWCRNNLRHFLGAGPFDAIWGYAGVPPVSRVIQGTTSTADPELGVCHWTAGCWGTTGFLQNVLRIVNIPVERVAAGGHSMPHFTTDDLYLSHGDDPYDLGDACTPAAPADELLIDATTFNSWLGPQLSQAAQAANVGRGPIEQGIKYLADWFLHYHYVDRQSGLSPQAGQAYQQLLQSYYPSFSSLPADLWSRMDAKLADFGVLPRTLPQWLLNWARLGPKLWSGQLPVHISPPGPPGPPPG
jgi:hypothetical protein